MLKSHKEPTEEHAQPLSAKLPPLSDEEKRKILSSQEFSRYFTQASRIIERALAEDVCVMEKYLKN